MHISVGQVAMLAIGAHGEQVDKVGVPYREHLRAVAEGLEPFGPMVVMAGWLHDIIEDTGWTAEGLRQVGVSARVVEVVGRVTRREGESYDDLITRVAADPVATLVKIADNAHNSLPARVAALTDEPERRRLEERYRSTRRALWPATTRENVITIIGHVNPSLLAEVPPRLAELPRRVFCSGRVFLVIARNIYEIRIIFESRATAVAGAGTRPRALGRRGREARGNQRGTGAVTSDHD